MNRAMGAYTHIIANIRRAVKIMLWAFSWYLQTDAHGSVKSCKLAVRHTSHIVLRTKNCGSQRWWKCLQKPLIKTLDTCLLEGFMGKPMWVLYNACVLLLWIYCRHYTFTIRVVWVENLGLIIMLKIVKILLSQSETLQHVFFQSLHNLVFFFGKKATKRNSNLQCNTECVAIFSLRKMHTWSRIIG